MRYLVNAAECDLDRDPDVKVTEAFDRLWIHTPEGTKSALAVRAADKTLVSFGGRTYTVEKVTPGRSHSSAISSGEIRAPMPGQVVDVFVEQGNQVDKGQRLLVLEAMKMQHSVLAPFSGTVAILGASKGEQVAEGRVLVHIEPENEPALQPERNQQEV
ncbi:MAG: biotin/lipoyl-binding protein [Chthonomonadaceae bacterium]|nr:biotin/lipoyl-binding protein [Chthonomonadaceae bacterium]